MGMRCPTDGTAGGKGQALARGAKDNALSLRPPTRKRLGARGLVRTHVPPTADPIHGTFPDLAVWAPHPPAAPLWPSW